jgi:2',3'-cyclic-nucleotide 2'-phosphodiesterase (5'-nucleotidase family)
MKKLSLFLLFALVIAIFSAPKDKHSSLTIAHINDTHAHIQPVPVNLFIDSVRVKASSGGFD